MKRVAYFSPVNPAPSGISDYSEELLPYLGQYLDLTLYLDDGLQPANPQLARHLAVLPISRFATDQRQRPYDAILYHMGNSPAHTMIWQTMQQTPGVLVLHDLVLHHFMLQYYATVLRDTAAYQAAATRYYGAEGTRVAEVMLAGRLTPAAFALPFCEPVLAQAEGLIAHSHYVQQHVANLRPDLPAAVVPMGVPLPTATPRNLARQQLGLPQDALILASFGHINPYKRLEAALRALATLRRDHGDVRYLLVGSVSPSYHARALVARAGLAEAVTITGYVARGLFEAYVAAADICLNLRHPTAGETSASLLRLLGAGKPTLVTASGSFSELPPDVAAQVDPDDAEGDLIVGYCRLLAARPALAAALGANARAYVASQHTLAAAAAGYVRFLAQRYGWGEQPSLSPPLWQPEPATLTPALAPPHGGQAEAPASAGPLAIQVAQALAELGVTTNDRQLLAATAAAMGVFEETH